MPTFTITERDLERLYWGIDSAEKGAAQIREVLSNSFKSANTPPAPAPAKKHDFTKVKWLVKGGLNADDSAPFAYAFAKDKDGAPNQYADLVDYLINVNEVTEGPYTYSLSDGGKFLQRKRVREN